MRGMPTISRRPVGTMTSPPKPLWRRVCRGLDVGTACLLANTPEFKPTRIKTVSWLTLLNNERLALAGGLDALRAQLPSSHFCLLPLRRWRGNPGRCFIPISRVMRKTPGPLRMCC
ncbi:type VI immunity family protein [Pseudomonas aeruginosa]